MTFVLDASVTLAGVMPDETSELADRLLTQLRNGSAVVPCVWPLEVANALAIAERRDRIFHEQSDDIVELLLELPIEVAVSSPELELAALLEFARQFGLSAYDASYLELAVRLNLPLATLDRRLRAAAEQLNLPAL